MSRIPVRLLKHHSVYNPGEIVGFVPEVADSLIAQGFAVAYDPEAVADASAAGAVPVDGVVKSGKAKPDANPLPAQGGAA